MSDPRVKTHRLTLKRMVLNYKYSLFACKIEIFRVIKS